MATEEELLKWERDLLRREIAHAEAARDMKPAALTDKAAQWLTILGSVVAFCVTLAYNVSRDAAASEAATEMAKQEFRSDLIKLAVQGNDATTAAKTLLSWIDLGILEDYPSGTLRKAAKTQIATSSTQTLPVIPAPTYTVDDVPWGKGLSRRSVQRVTGGECAPGTIAALPGKSGSPTTCEQSLAKQAYTYQGSIDGKLIAWWPPVFGEWPECACVPAPPGNQTKVVPAFP